MKTFVSPDHEYGYTKSLIEKELNGLGPDCLEKFRDYMDGKTIVICRHTGEKVFFESDVLRFLGRHFVDNGSKGGMSQST